MAKRFFPFLAALAVPALSSAVVAQPVGPEFQVNTYTTGDQWYSGVASDSSGNFVVVWQSLSQHILAQRYDNTGLRVGEEFQINTNTTGVCCPSVASDASGGFVVVWDSVNQDGDNWGAFARRYDGMGEPLGGEFQVNTYTTNFQGGTAVASDASGNFVIVWDSFGGDGSDWGIFGQRYDSTGARLGGEFRVNTYTFGPQLRSSVASDANGNFVVVWNSDDGSDYGIFGRRYDASGNSLGPEFQVNTYTMGFQGPNFVGSSVASDPNGNFVVVWESVGQDGSGTGILGQRYDANGDRRGGEFQVNTYITGLQRWPSVAVGESGNFVVTWRTYGDHDGSGAGVFGQRYDNRGPRGREFRVNTYRSSDQMAPSVAYGGDGVFVVVWHSFSQDRSGFGVFGQRGR